MGPEDSERLKLPRVGGIDAREEAGSNNDKGNGWPKTGAVDIGRWLTTVDTIGAATDDDISIVEGEKETRGT